MGKEGSSTLGFRRTQDQPLLLLPDNHAGAAEANPDPTVGRTGFLHTAWPSQEVEHVCWRFQCLQLSRPGTSRDRVRCREHLISSLTHLPIHPTFTENSVSGALLGTVKTKIVKIHSMSSCSP